MKSAIGLVLGTAVLGAIGLHTTRSGDATNNAVSQHQEQAAANNAGQPSDRELWLALLDQPDKAIRATISLGVPASEDCAFNSRGECLMNSWGTGHELGKYLIEVWAPPLPAADGSRSIRLVNSGNLSAVVQVGDEVAVIDGGSEHKVFRIAKENAGTPVKIRATAYLCGWSGREKSVPKNEEAK